jgi:hypothetical protein
MDLDLIQVEQPKNYKVNLYPHQLRSIYMMEKLEREKLVRFNSYNIRTSLGINADITGYGKTLSMIGMIVRNKMEWNLNEPFIITKNYSYSYNLVNKEKIYKLILQLHNSIQHRLRIRDVRYEMRYDFDASALLAVI